LNSEITSNNTRHNSKKTKVDFPNGGIINLPNSLVLFFETHSLENASPAFLGLVNVINLPEDMITSDALIQTGIANILEKNSELLQTYFIDTSMITDIFKNFVGPFVADLAHHPVLGSTGYFNIKSLFKMLIDSGMRIQVCLVYSEFSMHSCRDLIIK
jgi:hypothetical protein